MNFAILALLMVQAEASFQLCTNSGDYLPDKEVRFSCNDLDQTNCTAMGGGFSWAVDNNGVGQCTGQMWQSVAVGDSDPKAVCTAAGGTVAGIVKCSAYTNIMFSNPSAAFTKATCDATMTLNPMFTNGQMTAQIGGDMGCCGGYGKDVCSPLMLTQPLCTTASDFLPAQVYQIACSGLSQSECTGTGFEYHAGPPAMCNVKVSKGATSATLVSLCKAKGGVPTMPMTCGTGWDKVRVGLAATPTAAECAKASPQAMGGVAYNLYAKMYADDEMCCGSRTTSSKAACSAFSASTFQLCSNTSTYTTAKIIQYDCVGVAQGACTGTGFQWSTGGGSSTCQVKAAAGADLSAACTAKSGVATNGLTCGMMMDMFFKAPLKADYAGCNTGSNKMMSQLYAADCCTGGDVCSGVTTTTGGKSGDTTTTTTVKATKTTVTKAKSSGNTTKKSSDGKLTDLKTTTTTRPVVTYTGTMTVKTAATKAQLEKGVKAALVKKLKVAASAVKVTATEARRLQDSINRRLGTAKNWNVAFTIAHRGSTTDLEKNIAKYAKDQTDLTAELKTQLMLVLSSTDLAATKVSGFAAAKAESAPVTAYSHSLSISFFAAVAVLLAAGRLA